MTSERIVKGIIVSSIITGMTITFLLCLIFQPNFSEKHSKIGISFGMHPENLSKISESIIKEFYFFYNMSNINNTDLSSVNKSGGVCWQYAHLYTNSAIKKNLYAENVVISMTDKKRHEFSVVSNREGYCILDTGDVLACSEFV